MAITIGMLMWTVAGCDTLRLGNTSGDQAGLLVDGQDANGPVNDRGFLANGTSRTVGRLSESSSSNEVLAFTTNRPPKQAATPWTTGRDIFDVDFKPRINVPVTVWIVKGPFAEQRDHAIEACIRTSAIWNGERVGIAFSQFQIIDATSDPDASDHFAFPNGDAGDVVWKPLRDDIGFTPGRVNIYWVDTVNGSTTTGWSNFGAQIAMGRNTGDELLSHELGHALSLTHINGLPTFDQTNVMHNASNTRAYLTEGQLTRAHLNPSSSVNDLYAARPGETQRNCSRDATSDSCPVIGRRLWADGSVPAN